MLPSPQGRGGVTEAAPAASPPPSSRRVPPLPSKEAAKPRQPSGQRRRAGAPEPARQNNGGSSLCSDFPIGSATFLRGDDGNQQFRAVPASCPWVRRWAARERGGCPSVHHAAETSGTTTASSHPDGLYPEPGLLRPARADELLFLPPDDRDPDHAQPRDLGLALVRKPLPAGVLGWLLLHPLLRGRRARRRPPLPLLPSSPRQLQANLNQPRRAVLQKRAGPSQGGRPGTPRPSSYAVPFEGGGGGGVASSRRLDFFGRACV